MPATQIRFTQENVADLALVKSDETPPQREYRDTESDLWLKVGRKAKTFFVRSNKTGMEETIGRFTDGMTVKQARTDARLVLDRLDRGERKPRPAGEVQQQRAAEPRLSGPTLKHALEVVLTMPGNKGGRKVKRKESTADEYRKVLNRHTPADWWDKPLAWLDYAKVDAQHSVIGNGNDKVAAAGHVTADKWRAYLHSVYEGFCAANPSLNLPRNPVSAVKKFSPPPRTAVVKWKDMPKWWESANALPPIDRDCWKMLFLTGLRSNACSQLRWDEVDFDDNVIVVPAERMKAGEDFTAPISGYVRELLLKRKADNLKDLGVPDNGYVFPDIKRNGSVGPIVSIRDQRDERESPLTCPQTIRRTFNSIATNIGIPLEHRSILCDHRMPSGNVNRKHYYGDTGDGSIRQSIERVTAKILEGFGVAYGEPQKSETPDALLKQIAALQAKLAAALTTNKIAS